MKRRISLLGSTGSIGVNVLDVVRRYPDRFEVVALAAGSNVELLAAQALEFQPSCVSVCDERHGRLLGLKLPAHWHNRILWGEAGNQEVAAYASADITVSAIVGAAGLRPTLAAIQAGKDVGLANKETLVMAGRIVMDAVAAQGVQLLPVDSEHSAIFQALEAGRRVDVKKIILTASGGPFRGRTADSLRKVTLAEALNHPKWKMGKKISIDSATLMNKGLEVIEASWLFGMPVDAIEVLVHPQSIVHSLVEFRDGSVIAQLGIPDMRIPIAYALTYPERLSLPMPSLNLAECGRLDFFEPDHQSFPAVNLAYAALRAGGVLPAVLNAANEVAVEAFLQGRIDFTAIVDIVSTTMDRVQNGSEESIDDILAADGEARRLAGEIAGLATHP
ncbi:MAG: 1-deoxy-D-xylulose-5-phosphate reductoisomerase [Desulfobulbaceae bacterium]|nr:MAG: 1-deoxy-D-xylulose-5-phosphate reductoisomerase [Desulfobulbaceae bacterium]